MVLELFNYVFAVDSLIDLVTATFGSEPSDFLVLMTFLTFFTGWLSPVLVSSLFACFTSRFSSALASFLDFVEIQQLQ